MVQKVIVWIVITQLLIIRSVAADPELLINKKKRWVDSVMSTLSVEQKINQLIFKIDDEVGNNAENLGGYVLTGKSLAKTLPNKNTLNPLYGFLPDDYLFKDIQGINPLLYAASGNPELIENASQRSAWQIREEGFNFVFKPSGKLYPLNEELSKDLLLKESYLAGIKQSGLKTWDTGNHSGVGLSQFLASQGLTVDQLSKKVAKKLSKQKLPQIIYYETDYSDPFRLEALLLADVLLIKGEPGFYHTEILESINKKKVKKKNLDEKVRRILSVKYDCLIPSGKNKLSVDVLERELVENSITLLKNSENLLPVKHLEDKFFASLSLGVFEQEPFQESLDHYTYFSHFGEADFIHDQKELANTLDYYDHVVVGFSFPESAELDNNDILKRIEFLKSLSARARLTVVIFGGTKWISLFPFARSLVLAYDNTHTTLEVAPQLLFGALPFTARLPFTLEGYAANEGIETDPVGRLAYTFPAHLGLDPMIEKKIDYIVTAAIDSAATPGCQVLVAKGGRVILEKAYGYYTYDSIQPVTTKTIYDIASVTKVIGTLQATMFLEGRNEISVDEKISQYLSELKGTNKEDLVIRKILAHQAGLQSYFPFYRKTFRGDRLNPQYYQNTEQSAYNQLVAPGLFGHQALEDSVWSWTIRSRLRKKPSWQKDYDYQYSDLGFLMMHKLNERMINQPIEDFLAQNFYDPLGMSSTCYQPLCRFPLHEIAPTEVDYDFRNSLVWGMVHDENAALTGGVGGHAGLFSTANDLAILLQMNLQDGYYGGSKYLEKGTIDKFTRKQFPGNRRGLGWDKPEFLRDYRNTSDHSTVKTFGHLGFTGTAVWVDPEYDLIYVFLSNRVHPNRENDKLMVDNIRSRIHDVIYQSLPEFQKDS